MRRYLPALLLALAALTPFPLAGCDMLAKLKGGGDDAGAEAAVAEVALDAAPTPAATDTASAVPTTTLTPAVPTVTAVRPVTVVDAGAKLDAAAPIVDAAAPKVDSGAAPAPTPKLTLPPNLFDGGFKFDAGGFKPPWQR